MIKLVGIAVMALGFALRINTLLVVLAAGISTALVAGFSFNEVLAQFGTFFVENRYMTLPVVLLLPLIGMLEHHGLQMRAEILIRRVKAATAGRVILLYSVVRQVSVSLGVRIGDHASMVRPLVVPMAEAAAANQIAALRAEAGPNATNGEPLATTEVGRGLRSAPGPADENSPRSAGSPPPIAVNATLAPDISRLIRAHASAGENVGNFFGEDIFVAVGAVLLMNGFFQSVGMNVSLWAMAFWGIPTAVTAFLLMWWRIRVLDRSVVRCALKSSGQGNRA